MPGTSADWPSDITIAINAKEVGVWTSPGDFGDKRGVYTPDWWKLKGSQYGKLKSWRVTPEGAFVDGVRISAITPQDLDISAHHSIRLKIEVKPDARHPGGVNIFGRGFGNYDQDIVLQIDDRALIDRRSPSRLRSASEPSRSGRTDGLGSPSAVSPTGSPDLTSRFPLPSTISWPAGVST